MGDVVDFVPFDHFSTQAIHAGQEPERWGSRAVVPPISMATTFKQDEPGKHAVCIFFLVFDNATSSYMLSVYIRVYG